jgi:hypothetical protein
MAVSGPGSGFVERATVVFLFLVPGQLAQIVPALQSFLQRVPDAR